MSEQEVNPCVHEVVLHHSIPTLDDDIHESWWQCQECEQKFGPIMSEAPQISRLEAAYQVEYRLRAQARQLGDHEAAKQYEYAGRVLSQLIYEAKS